MVRNTWVDCTEKYNAVPGSKARSNKKRMTWSHEMEILFLKSVNSLQPAQCTPSNILREMGVTHLTREQVSSHLQKYRNRQKQSQLHHPCPKLSVEFLIS